MPRWFPSRWMCAAVLALAALAWLPTPIDASHAFSSHWQRTSAGIRNLPVRRMLSSVWLTRYTTAMNDWRKPAMTRIKPYTAVVSGQNPGCPLYLGQISVCDGNYGPTGWAGIAQVFYNSAKHTQYARAVQNNYYMVGSSATVVAFRQLVICQEIGHTFGLGHINVTYNTPNAGSCMDYTNDPDGGPGGVSPSDPNNMHPFAHDYAMINSRHNHIGFIMPELGSQEMPELESQEAEAPRAMEAMLQSTPLSLAQLGERMSIGNGGRTEMYEMKFAGGWGNTSWVIRFNEPIGR